MRAYAHTYGLPVTITNCSNNYGPYQFPEKLIPLDDLNALEGKTSAGVWRWTADPGLVVCQDHCEAIWMVLRKGKVGETYNIGGDNQPTNLTVVQTICDILDEFVPDSPIPPTAH